MELIVWSFVYQMKESNSLIFTILKKVTLLFGGLFVNIKIVTGVIMVDEIEYNNLKDIKDKIKVFYSIFFSEKGVN